jgi:oligopeptide/dipeptide ABC transporter ATP-binding protein
MMLTVENLSVEVQGPEASWQVIKNVSFSLQEGEKLGIVGESGSGKTLLMRALIGMLPPSIAITRGKITYFDRLLSEMKEHQLQKIRGREIGMVFQDPLTFLNPTTRVGKQIGEGYTRHFPNTSKKEAEAAALALLKKVGIPDPELRLTQFPHELSGGLRQRVLIAIALAAGPKLLIADEPTTALDVTIQAQIMNLLRSLQQDKSTILITHDLSLVASFCDRVIVMYAGQIVEDAPTRELFRAPQHPYTEQLLKSLPSLTSHAKLVTIPGSPPDLSKAHRGCPFAPRCPYTQSKCLQEEPPLFKVSSNHKSLCWLREQSC